MVEYLWPEEIPLIDKGHPDLFWLQEDTWVERIFIGKAGYKTTLWFCAQERMPWDGASVPRFFWRLIGSPFRGRYRWPSIFHDAGYKKMLLVFQLVQGELIDVSDIVTKEWIDEEFLNMMESRGVELWRRKAMFKAVDKFGTWDENRRKAA